MKLGSDTINPFITLRCNFNCPYCITKFSENYSFPAINEERTGWTAALNGLEDVRNFIINGGEPTMHSEFLDIMHNLKPCNLLAVGTNCSQLAFDVLMKMPTRKEIVVDVSYHPRQTECTDAVVRETDQLVKRVLALKTKTKNRVRVHAVTWPGYKDQYQLVQLNKFRAADIETFIQEYEGIYEGTFYYSGKNACMSAACDKVSKRKARCYRTIFLPVNPLGDVYICHALMYATSDKGILGNIFDGTMSETDNIICGEYGFCNPCDKRRIDVL